MNVARTPLRRAEILAGGAVKMSALDQKLPEERQKERDTEKASCLRPGKQTNNWKNQQSAPRELAENQAGANFGA
jgi:hypothetical protein